MKQKFLLFLAAMLLGLGLAHADEVIFNTSNLEEQDCALIGSVDGFDITIESTDCVRNFTDIIDFGWDGTATITVTTSKQVSITGIQIPGYEGKYISSTGSGPWTYNVTEGWLTMKDGSPLDSVNSIVVNYTPAENTVITYTAEKKLYETTNPNASGFHTNIFKNGEFQINVTKHEFADGVGTITFDGTVTCIGDCAFYGCRGLTGITIPNTVTTIGDYAFAECAITSIEIPSSVTSIGIIPLAGNLQLTSIMVDPENVSYKSDGNCLITKTQVGEIPANAVLAGCESSVIPDYVTSIGDYAFYFTSLIDIVIPGSVKNIGKGAFYYCDKLNNVTFENGIKSIDDDAFSTCM